MAMKKKNSLPDMYSPEKKFSGFFCVHGIQELKEKDKKTGKISFKKEELVRILVFLRFTFLYILHISKRQPAKRLPDFTKKSKIYRNSGGKNNETF